MRTVATVGEEARMVPRLLVVLRVGLKRKALKVVLEPTRPSRIRGTVTKRGEESPLFQTKVLVTPVYWKPLMAVPLVVPHWTEIVPLLEPTRLRVRVTAPELSRLV